VKNKSKAALTRLHESGFTHGDIANRNIVASPDFSVKLLNLGQSQNLGDHTNRVCEEELTSLRRKLLDSASRYHMVQVLPIKRQNARKIARHE